MFYWTYSFASFTEINCNLCCFGHCVSVMFVRPVKLTVRNAIGLGCIGLAILLAIQLFTTNNKRHTVYEIHNHNYQPNELFGCVVIDSIQVVRLIEHGIAMSSYLGEYENQDVILKIPKRNSTFFERCMEATLLLQKSIERKESWCTTEVLMRHMKEILFLKKLKHPNIIRLLGTCIRGDGANGDTVISRHDVAAYEYARHFRIDQALQKPWRTILSYALQLADLLFYLEHSPIGSILVKKLQAEQFLITEDIIKLSDVYNIIAIEPRCKSSYKHTNPGCDLNIQCRNGTCAGINAKLNMKQFYDIILQKLLDPAAYPVSVQGEIADIQSSLNKMSINANNLRDRLIKIIE